jgi:hypothetical protein
MRQHIMRTTKGAYGLDERVLRVRIIGFGVVREILRTARDAESSIGQMIRTAGGVLASTCRCGASLESIPPAQRNSFGTGVVCSMSGLVEIKPAKGDTAAWEESCVAKPSTSPPP